MSPNEASPEATGDPSPLSARLRSHRRNHKASGDADDSHNQLSMGWPHMVNESRNAGPPDE